MAFKIGDVVVILNNNNQHGPINRRDIGKVAVLRRVNAQDNEYQIDSVQGNFMLDWVFGAENIMFLGRVDAQGRFRLHGKFFPHHLPTIQEWVNAHPDKYPINRDRADNNIRVEMKKNEEIKKPEPPKIDLKGARNKCIGHIMEHKDGTCSYAVVRNDGTLNLQLSDVCHARLSPGVYAFESVHAQFNSRIKEEYRETYKKMVDWLVNRSHFADAFITKDAQFIIDNYAEYNTDCPLWHVFSAAVALRGFQEFPGQARSWKVLEEAGVEEKYLWIAALLFDENGNYQGTTDGHRTWGSSIPVDKLKKWFKQGFSKELDQTPMNSGKGSRFAFGAIDGTGRSWCAYDGGIGSVNQFFKNKLGVGKAAGPFGGEGVRKAKLNEINNLMKEMLE